MSANNISDAKNSAGLTDDKCQFDSSSHFDSGYLSAEIKEEFQDEEIKQQPSMRLDSILDEPLSNLSLKCNDFDKEVKIAEILEANSWEFYYKQDEVGDTKLHLAIVHELLQPTFDIISKAPHPRYLDTPNDDAQSPMHLAVATGQATIVRWLIAAGAKPSPRNIDGDSPLHIAARAGDVDCCNAILYPVQPGERNIFRQIHRNSYELCAFDQWNFCGQTSVHVAACNGQVDVLRQLVNYGADINAREGRSGYTPLHYAIEQNNVELVRFLLSCKTVNVHVLTYGGRSALQLGGWIKDDLYRDLLKLGVPSPYSSDDEDDSEDEKFYEDRLYNKPNMVINASA